MTPGRVASVASMGSVTMPTREDALPNRTTFSLMRPVRSTSCRGAEGTSLDSIAMRSGERHWESPSRSEALDEAPDSAQSLTRATGSAGRTRRHANLDRGRKLYRVDRNMSSAGSTRAPVAFSRRWMSLIASSVVCHRRSKRSVPGRRPAGHPATPATRGRSCAPFPSGLSSAFRVVGPQIPLRQDGLRGWDRLCGDHWRAMRSAGQCALG